MVLGLGSFEISVLVVGLMMLLLGMCWPRAAACGMRPMPLCDGLSMGIVVKLDQMLVLRKVKSRDLAAHVGITEANLSLLKAARSRGAL